MRDFNGFKKWLYVRLGEVGLGLYSFLGCLLTIALIGIVALISHRPLLAPSLGPTVLLFFESALQPAACPRNTLYGHGIGIAAGWLSLALFGLLHAPSALSAGFSSAHVGAASLSVALTALGKHLVRAPHPPAGATTLIVSLGLLKTPAELTALAAGVVLVTIAGWCTNRLLGVPMPVWQPHQ